MSEKDFGLVSILMAAYNAERTIESAIDSVIAQTYQNWELLVVNDGSEDNTLNIIKDYAEKDSRIILLNNEKNCGVSVSRLNGLKAAKGAWIAILDSDDIWLPEKLEKQIALQQRIGADFVFCGASYIDESGKPYDYILHVPDEIGYKKLLKQNVIHNPSALLRKELYSEYYAVGDDMHEDFAMWLGVLKSGISAYGIDEPLLVVRRYPSSKSGNKFKSAVMNWKTYRYMKLNAFSSTYYMIWYTINGILKYKNLK